LGSDPKLEEPRFSNAETTPLRIEKENVIIRSTMDGVSQSEYMVENPPSNPRSPTHSDMEYDEDRSVFGINTITLNEEYKFPFPKSEKTKFYSEENKYKRKWFFMKDPKQQEMWIKR
jgi:hypothetical protein